MSGGVTASDPAFRRPTVRSQVQGIRALRSPRFPRRWHSYTEYPTPVKNRVKCITLQKDVIKVYCFSFKRGDTWACSSVGRAAALQAEGQEFDSPQVHKIASRRV